MSTGPPTAGHAPPRRSAALDAALCAMILLVPAAVLLLAAVLPAAHVLSAVGGGLLDGAGRREMARLAVEPLSTRVLGATLGYAALIALLSTLLAWPAAWSARTRSAAWIAFLAVPLMLPNYLAYAGWGLLRAPGTAIGDWAASGQPWLSMLVNKALAVGGLSLWAWPLAALILLAGARRIDDALLDALALDAPGRAARFRVRARLLLPWLFAAFGVVALAMLGSAVPLHVAMIETYTMRLWFMLVLTPNPERVWVSAWPLLIVAAAAGIALAGAFSRAARARTEAPVRSAGGRPGPALSAGLIATALVWCASVAAPFFLFARSLPDVSSLHTFWRVSGAAVRASAITACWTGAACLLLGVGSWYAFSLAHGRARAVRAAASVSARVMLVVALVPGILIGAAVSASWNAWEPSSRLADSRAAVVAAHVARFGFIPILLGWWLAATEPRALRDARRLDGATGPSAWLRASLPAHLPAMIGAALACAALSLHEIEAAVILQPPGIDNLAQQLLENLHFARDEHLAAAAISILTAAAATAFFAAWLISAWSRPRHDA